LELPIHLASRTGNFVEFTFHHIKISKFSLGVSTSFKKYCSISYIASNFGTPEMNENSVKKIVLDLELPTIVAPLRTSSFDNIDTLPTFLESQA
jgi:hypothetical protein